LWKFTPTNLAYSYCIKVGCIRLVEKHEKEKREKLGMHGTLRGRKAASIDAAGASIGSIGLFAFALLVSQLLSSHTPWAVLLLAIGSWRVVSYVA
jgi:hypothetical protein